MNLSNLAGLFAALKNPTAMNSMVSALPSVENLKEFKPTPLELLSYSSRVFDPDAKIERDPWANLFGDYALTADGQVVDEIGNAFNVPDNTYMEFPDYVLDAFEKTGREWDPDSYFLADIGKVPRIDDEEPPISDDPSVFKNARKMLEKRLRRTDLGLPVPNEFSYPDDGLDDLPF